MSSGRLLPRQPPHYIRTQQPIREQSCQQHHQSEFSLKRFKKKDVLTDSNDPQPVHLKVINTAINQHTDHCSDQYTDHCSDRHSDHSSIQNSKNEKGKSSQKTAGVSDRSIDQLHHRQLMLTRCTEAVSGQTRGHTETFSGVNTNTQP